MPINSKGKSAQPQGPDPAVMEAIQRLVQTQLEPLEEVIFNSWMQANQLEESPDQPFDYRGLYKQTDGKVFAPGELGQKIGHQNAIQTLMQAQEAHDSSSPMKAMMDAMNKSPQGSMDPGMGASPDPGMSSGGGIGMDSGMGSVDNSNEPI